MLAQRKTVLLAAGGVVAACLWISGDALGAAAPFALTSTTFKDGTRMPVKVANKNQPGANPNPNCVGENVSPELTWRGAPEGMVAIIDKGASSGGRPAALGCPTEAIEQQ